MQLWEYYLQKKGYMQLARKGDRPGAAAARPGQAPGAPKLAEAPLRLPHERQVLHHPLPFFSFVVDACEEAGKNGEGMD